MDKSAFEKAAGAGSVKDDASTLESYASDSSYAAKKSPALVVSPGSTDDISSVIKAANDSGAKIIPVSSTGPRFRGDTVPSTGDTVMMDLSGLKGINWINRRNRVAIIEPGVTYAELQKAVNAEGMRCMQPLMPKAGKSVVAACAEREPFTVPKYSWETGDPVASTEMTMGCGDVMRTGGAAGPGTLEEQKEAYCATKHPMGPLTMDTRKITQGTQGSIAAWNWISVRLELLPEHERLVFVTADKLDDLIDIYYKLLYYKVVDEHYILNSLNMAAMLESDKKGIDALRKKLPGWILVATIGGYGDCSQDMFDWKNLVAERAASDLGVKFESEVGGITEAAYKDKILRKVSPEPYWKTRYAGDVRELFFLTSASKTPGHLKMVEASGMDAKNMGVYLQMVIQGKACHTCFDFYGGEGDLAGTKDAYTKLASDLFQEGAFYSRPYGPLSDIVYNADGYKTFVKYARGLKEIFDPNNVMNPGKLCF